MENEKAAIKRTLAQEARFREEKQQIVASMGGSLGELLTHSSDSRLQRKLANNSKRGSSSLLAEDMDCEKAAVKRTLAQETRFREEKQQIVESMGGSRGDLLTPSSDSRLQRKLANNSKRGSSSLLAQDSDYSFHESQPPIRPPEQAVPGAYAVVVNNDHPVPLDHNVEREEYQDDEQVRAESKKWNKKVYLYAAGAFLALTFGSLIGVMVALLSGHSTPSSSSNTVEGVEDGQCKLDRVALAQCANDILPVPECAKAAYQQLASTYMLGEEMCDSAHKGLVALAVSQTNYGDELVDPTVFYAMATLYFALGGMNWRDETGWLQGSSPCSGSWYGVYCSPSESLKLQLDNNRMQGTISTEIGLLSNLETFSISSNAVSGSLPSEIGLLPRLKYLTVDFTQIQSSLPSEIGNLEELVELSLTNTPLNGTLPTEIGNLINLEAIHLQFNQFTGTIPSELGSLVNIRFMQLGDLVGITGAFPFNMFTRLSNLEVLWIALPGLDKSPILDDIAIVTSLKELKIEYTDLSRITPTLSSLSHLEALQLDNNRLSGTMFTEIGLLSNLEQFQIRNSEIEGTLPSEFGLLTKLKILNVKGSNSLDGVLPSELGSLTNLEALNVYDTRISGTIPTEICALDLSRGLNFLSFRHCRNDLNGQTGSCIYDTCN